MNLMPFTLAWLVLLVIAIVMGIYRQALGRHEDETVHLGASEAAMVSQQKSLAKKIESAGRWLRWLVALTLVYGVVLLAVYFHRVWIEGAMPR